jgi:hypothetical protein
LRTRFEPEPNLMFEVRFSQIIKPEPKRRFRFGVSANLNIRLRTEPFFKVRTWNSEMFFYIHRHIRILRKNRNSYFSTCTTIKVTRPVLANRYSSCILLIGNEKNTKTKKNAHLWLKRVEMTRLGSLCSPLPPFSILHLCLSSHINS